MVFDFAVLPAFVISALVIILSPGADSFLVLRSTIRGGIRGGFAAMLGVLTGLIILSVLLISGVGILVAKLPGALFWLKILGALYLLYLAVRSLLDAISLIKQHKLNQSENSDWEESTSGKKNKSGPYLMGILTNLTNPKVLVFFVAFFPQFIGKAETASVQLTMLCLVFMLSNLLWQSLLVFAAHAMRRVMTTAGFTIAMEFVVALVFAVLAIVLLITGVNMPH